MNGDQVLEAGRISVWPPGEKQTARRVLVVAEDDDTRRINVDALTHFGYTVNTATDGAAGWQVLGTHPFDLVLTDNRMPKLTGMDLIQKLRAARKVLPVIWITDGQRKHEFERRPWLIPDATLPEPYTATDLLRTVSAVLA